MRTAGRSVLVSLLSLLFLFGMFLAFSSGRAGAKESKKHVLILNSYNKGYSWTDNEVKGIESVLAQNKNLEVHVEYMDSKLVNDLPSNEMLRDLYRHKYRSLRFDVIIVTDDDALEFLKKYREVLFPGVPAVFCGINNFKDDKIKGHDYFTGVNEEADFGPTIDLAHRLNPSLKRFIVINDQMTSGLLLKEEFKKAVTRYEPALEFVYLDLATMEEVREALARLKTDSAVFYLSFFRDKSGQYFSPTESIPLMSKASKVPVYGAVDYMLGYGIVGGMLKNSFYQGETAGLLALRVLAGEQPGDIPIVRESPNHFMFDYNQLQRFGISLSNLPKESIIINQPESFYYKHKQLIWGVAAIIIGLIAFIFILLVNIRQRIVAQRKLVEYQSQLEELVEIRTREVLDSHNRLTTILDGSLDEIVYAADMSTYEILYINKHTRQLTGDVTGKICWQSFYPSQGGPCSFCTNEKLLDGKGEPTGIYQWQLHNPDNDRWYLVSDQAVRWINGAMVHLEIATDITNLRNAQEKLAEAEKMASLGGLVAGVAHEINTPVGIAVTTASHLLDMTAKLSHAIDNKTAKKDDLFNYVNHATRSSELILTNLERTSELVKSFKMVSADQTSHEMRTFNLKDYLEKVVLSLGPTIKNTPHTITVSGPEDIEMSSYPGALAQVITNFVVNALMHAFTGEDKGVIAIELTREGDTATIRISDNGRGIPQENLSKIYDPFFTTNRAGGGTGLGLHIVYNVVRQTLQGSITCESTVGMGTSFIVSVPLEIK